jgi:flagellar M-ring protein FliF
MQYLGYALNLAKNIGFKRGVSLLVAFAVFVGMLTLSTVYFNKPVREVLYSGLGPEDVNQIGTVLGESGIPFDVNEAGTAVLVDYGKTAQARMILAEKGLPKSDKAGYQLFDQMGSLGLTSFMQQVTRVRALEGELVRTIQQIDGVKTARVHLALKPENSFHGKDDAATASVVIRTNGRPSEQTISSIRQIVAAAIPGLLPEHVTVMTTDGTMLSNSSSSATQASDRLLELEKNVSDEAQSRIERTISPLAGLSNIRISVTADLNADKKQINETNFDPDSKVERSTRTVKSSDSSSDGGSSNAVTADQNVPQEVKPAGSGDATSSKKKESKEETVNYEVNSKQTTTAVDGYKVEKLSIAVVVNKQALLKLQGANPDEKKLDVALKEIEAVAKSAAGFDEKRGDVIHVSAVDFMPEDATLEPLPGAGIMETLKGNLGTLINALAFVIVTLLVLLLGLKPTLRAVAAMGSSAEQPLLPAAGAEAEGMGMQPALGVGAMDNFDFGSAGMAAMGDGPNFGTSGTVGDGPRERLNRVIGGDTERAAQVLKQWLNEKPSEAA